MSNDERDQIDSLLDNALASYARQDPLPGLERRVLDRIHADRAPRRVFPHWAWAVPVAAGLLWAGIFWTRHTATPSRPQAIHIAAAPAAVPPVEKALQVVKRPHKKKALPKLPQFPAPAPVTNEERALLAFVARAPKEAQESLLEVQQQSAEPIRIEEIKIEPLQ